MNGSTNPLTREAARELDRRAAVEFELPGLLLMENAGAACARLAARLLGRRRSVVVCCGKGNNGGDGFVVARHLDALGGASRVDVRVLLFADEKAVIGDAGVNLAILRRTRIPLRVFGDDVRPEDVSSEFNGTGLIVDGLLGTGVRGAVAGRLAVAIQAINAHRQRDERTRVLAIDLPSGLEADTGTTVGPVVVADVTATMVAPKVGFAAEEAIAHTGAVVPIDIGLPGELREEPG